MGKLDIIEAIKTFKTEKGIDTEIIFKSIEEAMATAYKKSIRKEIDIEAIMDRKTGEVKYYQTKKIVEQLENPDTEISLEEVKKVDEEAEPGDKVRLMLPYKDMTRVAIQSAKNIIIQNIKGEERRMLYEEFKVKENEVVTGFIQRRMNRTVYINIGKTEAILPVNQQVRSERYNVGDRLKVFVLEVKKTDRGPKIIVSRTSSELVKKLFEFEVAEVFDKTIEIRAISRDPGSRTKIGVYSHDSNVDPVGTCVGTRGSRIQAIVRELSGEKIDVIPWNDLPEVFIKNSLKPAQVDSVTLNLDKKAAIVVVPKEQFSLAIGKRGQNVMLASKLTGWSIDIKTGDMATEKALQEAESLFKTEEEKSSEFREELKSISGVGEKTFKILSQNNIKTITELRKMNKEELIAIKGIGEKTAERLYEELNKG